MTKAFRALLEEGIRKFAAGGSFSESDLQEWLTRLHVAIERELPTDEETRDMLRKVLGSIYKRDVGGGIQQRVPGITRYTLDRISPQLRAELDRRIFAGVDLIKLNRRAAVQKTLQRFAGWITSVPLSGTSESDLRSVVTDVGKSLAQTKFEARRVAIDQGHKLSAAVAHVAAMAEGVIAGRWHDRGEHDPGYNARKDHLARSGRVFLIRDSWAMQQGLVRKPPGAQFTDDFEQPAELPYCSCYYEYIVSPHSLPPEMLTAKGKAWLTGRSLEAIRGDSTVAGVIAAVCGSLQQPSPAQLEAGNYAKHHLRVIGLDVTIETPKGEMRYGIGADGGRWQVPMPAHYGYIRRTLGDDDEHLDCYVGPDPDAPTVWIIRQQDPDSQQYDEEKAMIGFSSRAEAISTYVRGFSDGRGQYRIQSVAEMSAASFRAYALRTARRSAGRG